MHVKDMEAAVHFYRDIMGFDVLEQTDEWSELKLNDKVSLALQKVSEPGSGIGFMVDDCEKATQQLKERGAEILKFCEKREKDGIILTQFKDADGQILWITQRIM